VTVEISSHGVSDTMAVGRRLAGMARPGDVIVLDGGLGAGKTAFTAGFAEGLGVEEPIVSPTFVLARRYESGFVPLVHADVYRLGTLCEFDDLDLLEDAEDAVLVIEWGGAVVTGLPGDHLRVRIHIDGEEERTLHLEAFGTWRRRPLEELVA
jgi:tRNA threonylcarbamoyladenosine biosynthesis protein TsaE